MTRPPPGIGCGGALAFFLVAWILGGSYCGESWLVGVVYVALLLLGAAGGASAVFDWVPWPIWARALVAAVVVLLAAALTLALTVSLNFEHCGLDLFSSIGSRA